MDNKIVIAIDGHSSCGKSTLAKDLARTLNYIYVDTGAMYRCVTLFALRHGFIDNGIVVNPDELKNRLDEVVITFQRDGSGALNTLLNGELVEDEIRSLEVSRVVSPVSALSFVRTRLVALQQAMGDSKGIVMDGRDIGTVVFPQAELKIFLTASAQVRAQRRYDELTEKGDVVEFDAILENVVLRDKMDESREVSPLRKAEDAYLLDNSEIGKVEQLDLILAKVQEVIA